VGRGSKNWWVVAVAATVGDAGVEGVVVVVVVVVAAAAVSAVGRRDQFGMDNQSFAAISGCNLAWAGARYFVLDGWAELDSPA